MTGNWNGGSAILIVGALFLHYAYGMDEVVTIAFCALGVLTWAYIGSGKERKRIRNAKVRIAEAKARYWEKKADETARVVQ
jgi:hypothetical protein